MKCSLIALTPLLFFTPLVFSQNPPGGGPPPIDRRTNADRIRQQDMSNREWQLRNFGKNSGAPKDRRQVEALMDQTEEDFNRILTLHNQIARALASNDALDYRFVSDATAEIRKRASRVQSSLALNVPAEETLLPDKTDPFKDSDLKDALIKLCKQIRSFVTNPSIENPNTVDAQQLTKARRDLESVIQTSGQIKKDADKLRTKK
jgi:hypothetical protein